MPLLFVGGLRLWWRLIVRKNLFSLLLRATFLAHTAQESSLLQKLFTSSLLRLLLHSLFYRLFLGGLSPFLSLCFFLILFGFAPHPGLPCWSFVCFLEGNLFRRRRLVGDGFLFFKALFVWRRNPIFPGLSDIVMKRVKELTSCTL